MNNFDKQRILVISIIGPQNSGKSTLLNYMFGTLFEVREGRCTRGIYGSFVKCNNIPDIDYIMLIDTEGLLSIEKSDKEYDRRLVLFCLAVSHLVIVNMLGDINETLKDMLTLCTDSLKRLDVGKVPKPTVHFVLNQKADPNIKNHLEAIDKIISDLKDQDLAETIYIGPDTFHTLPSAFKRERLSNDTNGPCLLHTEPDFIELTQKLVLKITLSAKQCYDRGETTNFTPRYVFFILLVCVFLCLNQFY
jgi:energy-coupling factor transporter ATP-binding protein EcfA2